MRLAIIGLGLMGGSIAKSIVRARSSMATRGPISKQTIIYGYDREERTIKKAINCGAIDKVLKEIDIVKMDLVIVALRPGDAIDFVIKNKDRLRANLVDICGVKRKVEKEILPLAKERGFAYLGSHPMAGKEVGGFDNSAGDLFDNRSIILVDNETSYKYYSKDTYKDLFMQMGFTRVELSSADKHDMMIAYTSQLAHIVSNSFARSPLSKNHKGYSANSLMDLTRVARLDSEMWTELFLMNKDYLSLELGRIIDDLKEYKQVLDQSNAQALNEMLSKGSEMKKDMF